MCRSRHPRWTGSIEAIYGGGIYGTTTEWRYSD